MGPPNPPLITSKLPTPLGMPGHSLLSLRQGLCPTVRFPGRGNGKWPAWGTSQALQPLCLKRLTLIEKQDLGIRALTLR